MNLDSTQNSSKPTSAAIALFAASAILVGAIGSVQIARAGICAYPIPFERMLPVALTAEVFAYSAVMLVQLGGTVPVLQVVLAAILGMGLRALQACLAAVLGSPESASNFGSAFAYYYAENYYAALLQVFTNALLLWLIRGMFEKVSPVPLIAPSDVPDMEPERLRGFHQGDAERRRELIEQLMSDEAEDEPPAADAPAETPAADASETPAEPEGPPEAPVALTPQESVVLALREEEDEEQELPDAGVADYRPEPSSPQLTLISQAVTDVTAPLGAGTATVRLSESGRTIAIAAGEVADLEAAASASEAVVAAGTALCDTAELGRFEQVLVRLEGGFVGGAAILREGNGFFVTIALPPEANFGVASSAVAKLADITVGFALPEWPPPEPPDLPPALPDDDLLDRVAPLLEWVPEAAGLEALAASVGGRQVVILSRDEPIGASAAVAVRGFQTASALCSSVQRPEGDLVLWSGAAGALACGSACIAGQHLVLCVTARGANSSVHANMQLGQILKGLARLAEDDDPSPA